MNSLPELAVRIIPILAYAVAAASSAGAQTAPERVSDRFYEYHVEPNVMVPMRDGVRLASDIYRPARNGAPVQGQFPVLVYRVPYGTPHPDLRGAFFARNGYVFIAQDSRGVFDSEGVFTPFLIEGLDGYDAVQWAAEQPWSNGQVATWGGSYSGLTQMTLGIEDPPALTSQFIREMHTNAFKTGSYVGGAFHMRRIAWVVGQATRSQAAAADPMVRAALNDMQQNLPDWIDHFPASFRRGATPLSFVPTYEDFLASLIENRRYGDFWRQTGLNTEEHWDRYADVPVYWLGGWYDIYTAQPPQQYTAMTRRKSSPQKLIMGPWVHGPDNIGNPISGDVDFGGEAALDFDYLTLRWYDQTVKGIDTGVLDEPPIKLFVMGGGGGYKTSAGYLFHGGEWRFEEEWPLARAVPTEFYFHADGTLRTSARQDDAEPTVYTHDPRNPVPTVGGGDSFGEYGVEAGGFDQRDTAGVPLRLRPDVITFETAPLTEDVEVTGPIMVRLYVSSSAEDTDITVKLVDVYPPSGDYPQGYELNLTDGIQRASYRESLTDRTPLIPGEVFELEFEIPPTSNRFVQGHKIRVDIASSNFPRFEINPGVIQDPWSRRVTVEAENRIYHDRNRRSYIIIPLVPVETSP